MEEIAQVLGCKPNLVKYALTDPRLWYHLVFGLYTVYQFRLEGEHRWSGARDAIIHTNDRIAAALQNRNPCDPCFPKQTASNGEARTEE